jgi:hypothetical protein
MQVTDTDCCIRDSNSPTGVMTELDEILTDPTLDSCCRRDILEQKRVSALKETLLRMDRTTHQLKLTNEVIVKNPPHSVLYSNEEADLSSVASSSDEGNAGE